MAAIRLGLIGDNIARSQSPRLHTEAGRLTGLDVTYERLIPSDIGEDFDAVFARCEAEGYRGINITYPYKERVFSRLSVKDPAIRAIGACNTVLFENQGPTGHNTDFTGFSAAFRQSFFDASPGRVAMIGAGGVGKAIAFALAELGCTTLSIFDRDAPRARALTAALATTGIAARVAESAADALEDSDGVINCTPLGMVGHPGSAVPKGALTGRSWAFDAVYTPVDTQFLADAEAAGLKVMSGYELFFHQGVDAFRLFTGVDIDQKSLRAALTDGAPAERQVARAAP